MSADYYNDLFGVYAFAQNPFISSSQDFINIYLDVSQLGDALPALGWREPFRLTYDNYVFYRLDTLKPVDLAITHFDLTAQTASGTFAFTAINDELTDTLVVTNGRFDVEFVR